jgi:tRNA(Ser,Leu) C12 N-acetylase TAN1
VFFSSFIIKILKSSKRGSIEKKREKVLKKEEGKRKALRVSTNKKGSQYFERRKTSRLQNLFT